MEKFEGVSQRLQLATRWSFKVRVIYEEIINNFVFIFKQIEDFIFIVSGFVLEYKDI